MMTGLKQSLERGDTLIYFHPIDICEEKFPQGFSVKRPFYWAVKGACVEKRIKYILSRLDGQTTTCHQIASES